MKSISQRQSIVSNASSGQIIRSPDMWPGNKDVRKGQEMSSFLKLTEVFLKLKRPQIDSD